MNKQLKTILVIESLIYLANGLFTPAWYVTLSQRSGGVGQFGLLFGLIAIGSVGAAYSSGWLSSRRQPMVLLSYTILAQAIIIGSYIIISSDIVVYILQILYGALSTAILTLEQILVTQYIGDKIGGSIGKFNSVVQGIIGVSMIGGGILVGYWGTQPIIITSAIILVVTSVVACLQRNLHKINIQGESLDK